MALALLLTLVPLAQADSDHDQARAAVQAGQILPLKAVLDQLEKAYPGQVLEVELERSHERWVYEVRLLQADGKLMKLELDAATAQILRRRSRHGDR